MNSIAMARASERGGAGVKFLIVFVFLILAANAGYNYVPIAYAGENFKQEMDTAVVNGLATPGRNPVDVVTARLRRAANDNNLPSDAVIDVKFAANTIQAHAVYSKPVHLLPFGMYTYIYQFDYTAVPMGYLLKDTR